MLAAVSLKFGGTPVNLTCQVTALALPASSKRRQPQRQDWLTGSVGLNINYSIILQK